MQLFIIMAKMCIWLNLWCLQTVEKLSIFIKTFLRPFVEDDKSPIYYLKFVSKSFIFRTLVLQEINLNVACCN